LARIVSGGQSLAQESLNRPLGIAVEFCNLFFGGAGNLNSPAQ
jgi:hypothetical protein